MRSKTYNWIVKPRNRIPVLNTLKIPTLFDVRSIFDDFINHFSWVFNNSDYTTSTFCSNSCVNINQLYRSVEDVASALHDLSINK